ncbi:unnamed protein product, partial [marine sediment metagenome]
RNKKWEIDLIPGAEQSERLKEALARVVSLDVVKKYADKDRAEVKAWEKENLK